MQEMTLEINFEILNQHSHTFKKPKHTKPFEKQNSPQHPFQKIKTQHPNSKTKTLNTLTLFRKGIWGKVVLMKMVLFSIFTN